MADWYGMCRSNYVIPKDPEAFRDYVELFPAKYIELLDRGGVLHCGFYSIDEYGGLPSVHIEEEEVALPFRELGLRAELDDTLNIMEGIHTVLAPNQVIYAMEVGNEKQRYATGKAFWADSNGNIDMIDLETIVRERIIEQYSISPTFAEY
jgi:hypothetical protein